MPPRFMTNIRDAEVFVAEGEPAMFECRVEPKMISTSPSAGTGMTRSWCL